MSVEAQLRVESLEMAAALLAVAVVAVRPKRRAIAELELATPIRLHARVMEFGATRDIEALCPLVVGRSPDVGIVLADGQVSRRHARFDVVDGIVYVRDLGSVNGTYLNGKRITEAVEVRPGDDIDVGTARITIAKMGEPQWT